MAYIAYSLQSHTNDRCIVMADALRLILPVPLADSVIEYEGSVSELSEHRAVVIAYMRAWNYLMGQHKLTAGVIRRTHALVAPDISDEWSRRCTLSCGKVIFPPRRNMRDLIHKEVAKYSRSGNIARLAFNFLRLHPFIDGNGRVVRLLISWHYGRHILFKTNKRAARHWGDAVHSSSWQPLARLIANTAGRPTRCTPSLCGTMVNHDDTTTTTTTTTTTQSPSRLFGCGWCAGGIGDCCDCPGNYNISNTWRWRDSVFL